MTAAVEQGSDASTTAPAADGDRRVFSETVIDDLHATVAGVDDLPLDDRVDAFERINATIVDLLADLDQL